MLAYIFLWAPATVAMAALWALIFALGYVIFIRPLLDWLPTSGRRKGGRIIGFFVDVANILPRAISTKVQRFVKEHVALLLRTYVNGIDPLVLFVLQLDTLATRIAGTLADQAEQIHEALRILRRVTIPTLIAEALAPIRARLDRHTERLDTLEDLNRRVAGLLGDTLRALPWGVPGGYVTNFETFLGRFVQLWEHYWQTTRVQLNRLLDETVPDLLRRVEALERGAAGGVGQALQGLRNRIEDLERWRTNVVMPRLQALEQAVDTLATSVLGDVGEMLRPMLERIIELERQVQTLIPEALQALRDDLAQLRTELEEGIETGLEVFRERIAALELEVFTQLPQRLAAMQLAIDALAAEVFEEVGAGLSALTERIVAIEQEIQTRILPGFDLILGRIEAVEANIRDNVLPRIAALEDLLAPAAFAALVLATLRTAAPNLFCRNVTRTTEAVCRLDEGWVDDLLALGLPVLVLADLCTLMRAFQAAAGGAVSLLTPLALGAGGLVECEGKGAAEALPLNTTALPTPTAALAL